MRKIEASDEELQALGFLLDAAVKYLGLQGAANAVLWKNKIEGSEEIEHAKGDETSPPAE